VGGRSSLGAEFVTIEKFLISNYVRLCAVEGIKPRDAYKELAKRLEAVNELKAP
jgi:hypothetical protein